MAKTARVGFQKNLESFGVLFIGETNSYINAERFQYAILEKVDQIVIGRLESNHIVYKTHGVSDDKTIPVDELEEWDKGRLFGVETELKWIKRKNQYHAVIITEESAIPEGFTEYSSEAKPLTDDNENPLPPRYIYLWGEKQLKGSIKLDEWYEPRIPQILKYPIENWNTNKMRIAIKIQEYELNEKNPMDTEDEFISIIHRYVDLKEK